MAVPGAVSGIATHAEALGFGSLWVTDHIAMPLRSGSRYPYTADGSLPWDPAIPYLDALSALAWVAALTRSVRLGTSVLVLPMRHPLPVAKAVATIDYLSGGRAVLAVGAGWFEEEFALLGQSFHDRGRRLDDAVRLLRACWGPDPVRYQGRSTTCRHSRWRRSRRRAAASRCSPGARGTWPFAGWPGCATDGSRSG